jgi:hypothetical protein
MVLGSPIVMINIKASFPMVLSMVMVFTNIFLEASMLVTGKKTKKMGKEN